MKRVVVTNTRTAETVEGLLLADGAMLVTGHKALLALKAMLEPWPDQTQPLVTRLVEGEDPVTGYVAALDITHDPEVREAVRVRLQIQPVEALPPGLFATRSPPPAPRCPFRKGSRYSPKTWKPRNRAERRWRNRVALELQAQNIGLRVMPGEPTRSLAERFVDELSPGYRKAVQRMKDAANPAMATGADLRRLAELYGVPAS